MMQTSKVLRTFGGHVKAVCGSGRLHTSSVKLKTFEPDYLDVSWTLLLYKE